MSTQVRICNMALVPLGALPISSIDDTSKEATTCKEFWEDVLDEVLRAHKWDFAKKWSSLTQDSEYVFVDGLYAYAYVPPSDFIRVSKTYPKDINYEIRANRIVANESVFTLEYIYRITDVTKFPVHFCHAMSSLLRVYLALPLAKKGTKAVDWMKLYLSVDLPSAQTSDAQGGNPSAENSKQHTVANDGWLVSR